MGATGTIRARKPSVVRWLADDFRRALLACSIAFTLCVAAVLAANWVQGTVSQAQRSRATGEALSTGSMLVVSPGGDLCSERTIDNSTWEIRNKGLVNCEEARARSANGGARTPGSRLDAIREGFVGKQ
jgi:predicted lysophospholipase L1 biosynthesis ABC-type transport system permease subunit